MRRLFLSSLFLFALLAPLFGCSSRGTVSGKVYYKGKALPGGDVRFFPENQGGSYYASIASDGSYSLSKLPPGPTKVTVSFSNEKPTVKIMPKGNEAVEKAMKKQKEAIAKVKGEGAGSGGNTNDAKEIISLPEKYADPDQSGLRIEVSAGSRSFDIKLD
jgi:hypothetical protein